MLPANPKLSSHTAGYWAVALFITLLVGCPLAACTTSYPSTQAASNANKVGEHIEYFSYWCKKGCIALDRGDQLIDPLVLATATVAYTYEPNWRPLARTAHQYGIHVAWAQLGYNTSGEYDAHTHEIRISHAHYNEPTSVTATALGPEVVHAATPADSDPFVRAPKPVDSIPDEMASFSWEAGIYENARLVNENSKFANSLDTLISKWHAYSLRDMVLHKDYYDQECSAPLSPTTSSRPHLRRATSLIIGRFQ